MQTRDRDRDAMWRVQVPTNWWVPVVGVVELCACAASLARRPAFSGRSRTRVRRGRTRFPIRCTSSRRHSCVRAWPKAPRPFSARHHPPVTVTRARVLVKPWVAAVLARGLRLQLCVESGTDPKHACTSCTTTQQQLDAAGCKCGT